MTLEKSKRAFLPILATTALIVGNASAEAVTALPADASEALTNVGKMVGFAGTAAIAIAVAWVLAKIVIRAIKGFGK